MTQEEIIQAISDDKTMPFIQPEQLAQIVEFVIENYRPSILSNLDEAAEEYSENILANNEDLQDAIEDAYKAGAQWRDTQIPKLPNSLDEAADCYKDTIGPEEVDDYANGVFYETFTEYQIADAFKAGAEWMAGQGATCNGKIQMDFSAPADIYARRLSADYWNELGPALMKVEPGDVLIQIRKKQ